MVQQNYIQCNNYKTLKWPEPTTLKLPLATEALIWHHIMVGGGEFVEMQLLRGVFGF